MQLIKSANTPVRPGQETLNSPHACECAWRSTNMCGHRVLFAPVKLRDRHIDISLNQD